MRLGLGAIALAALSSSLAYTASAQDVRLTSPAAAVTPHIYGEADYVYWSVKAAPLAAPLISTGPFTNLNGDLFNSSSTILYGAPQSPGTGGKNEQNLPGFSGGRLRLGYTLDPATGLGIEIGGFGLQTNDKGYRAGGSGGSIGTGYGYRIPVYNTTPYPGGGPIDGNAGENGLPVFLPGIIGGAVAVSNRLNLWGLELQGTYDLLRGSNYKITGLLGVRYLDLSEDFDLIDQFYGTGGPFVGQSGTARDHFGTRNRFIGPGLGVRGEIGWGPFSINATGRVAFGASVEELNVVGGFVAKNYYVTSGPQGIFAQPSNSGRSTRTDFAVNPEFQVKLGYDVTPNIRLTVGYDFLYLSSVVRPGDQLDRNIPKGQVFQQNGTPVSSTTQPASVFKTTDFYAQGLSAGVTFRF